jgi:hypothetical protein
VATVGTLNEDFLVDGTSLMTYAYAIQTLTGRERLPVKIGDNIRIPYRNGRIWKPKTYDEQVITLGMWVQGCDVNGHVPTAGSRAQLNSNLRALRKLFGPTGRQLQLQRILQYATGQETHTALGEVASGSAATQNEMDMQFVTPRFATFTVDIVMADPWWYGPPIVTTLSAGTTTIAHPGDVEATAMTITFAGPLTNPRLTNQSISPVVNVVYLGSLASGQTVTLDCTAFTAINQIGTSVIGSVSHAGSLRWMLLEPGNNTMVLDNAAGGSVGAGSCTVTYSPPYT